MSRRDLLFSLPFHLIHCEGKRTHCCRESSGVFSTQPLIKVADRSNNLKVRTNGGDDISLQNKVEIRQSFESVGWNDPQDNNF